MRKHNHPGACFPGSRDCELEETDSEYREYWAALARGDQVAGPDGTRVALPCIHRGSQIPRSQAPDPVRDWFECHNGFGVVCACHGCNSTCTGYAIANTLRIFDRGNLFAEVPGVRFNASICEYLGNRLIAFRNRGYASEIWVGELDREWRPIGMATKLTLQHDRCRDGQDDPRFFRFRGRLHVTFTGVKRSATGVQTSVLYARLTDQLTVDEVFYCDYPKRNHNEKNWGFFEHGGELFASYSIAPHRVLHVEGERCRLEFVTATRAFWPGGEMRGGACPHLVRSQWYSFFHSSQPSAGAVDYTTGLAVFNDEAPFRIESITDRYVLFPFASSSAPHGKRVVFTCGAYYPLDRTARWILSSGRDDRFITLEEADSGDLQAMLQPTEKFPHVDVELHRPELEDAGLRDAMHIDGWCSEEKLFWLGSAIKTFDCRFVVELGVWHGRSLVGMALAMKAKRSWRMSSGFVLGIDSYNFIDQTAGLNDDANIEWASKVDWDRAWSTAVSNVKAYAHGHASILRVSSSQAVRFVADGIDLLHVDANHSTEQAFEDVVCWPDKVRSGGIIVLDDIDWESVKPAYDELKARAEPIHNGGTWAAFRKI